MNAFAVTFLSVAENSDIFSLHSVYQNLLNSVHFNRINRKEWLLSLIVYLLMHRCLFSVVILLRAIAFVCYSCLC